MWGKGERLRGGRGGQRENVSENEQARKKARA